MIRKHIISAVALMLIVWSPLILVHFDLLEEITLHGVEDKADNTKAQLSWWDGSYQATIEKNLVEEAELKKYMIKLKNQFQYSLFGKINANHIYEYNGQMFRFYCSSYNEDWTFVGKDSLQSCVNELVKLQNYLGKEKCPIITLFAPVKSRYYSELLPEKNVCKGNNTNYEFLLNALEKSDISYIDFNNYFVRNKGKFDAAIFANGGIHWTKYAGALAMDSLVNFVSLLKGIEFDKFDCELYDCGGYNELDMDLYNACNLLSPMTDTSLRCVSFSPNIRSGRKINAVIVADSYFFVVEQTELRKLIFTEDSDYHYYFNTTRDADINFYHIDHEKIYRQLQTADCVILLQDLVNTEQFGFGFAKAMNDIIKQNNLVSVE